VGAFPVLEGGVFHTAHGADAGVVDQHMQGAAGLRYRVHRLSPLGLAGYVVRQGDGLAANGFGHGVGAVCVDVGNRDPGAFARQHLRRGFAQAAGCAGDQRHLSGYSAHV